LHDRLSLPRRGQLVVAIIGSAIHVGKLGVAHGEIALPASVAAIRFRQTVSDYEAVAVGLERADKVTLIYLRVAEPVIRTRQIALPAGVAGIGFRQPMMARLSRYDVSAAARSPCAFCMSPTLFNATASQLRSLAWGPSAFPFPALGAPKKKPRQQDRGITRPCLGRTS
jgi:hypothetical protein